MDKPAIFSVRTRNPLQPSDPTKYQVIMNGYEVCATYDTKEEAEAVAEKANALDL